MSNLILFTGNSNSEMAKDICRYLEIKLGDAQVTTFSDGETRVEIRENVRGKDIFVLQSTCAPANNYLMELLIMIDAFKRSSVRRITAVIPYYGYARQDKKNKPRVPISAKLVADLLQSAGANRMITMDLHANQIQGFFDIPVDNLFAKPVLLEHIKSKWQNNIILVSPDAGGVERARAFAKYLGVQIAIIDKRRIAPNQAEAMHVVGEVEGKIAVILDDMVDTAGTLTEAATALKKCGALEVHACCAHAVLSGSAIKRINDSEIQTIVVTNTIPLNENTKGKGYDKIRVLSVSKILADAIHRCHTGQSVSSLFI
ncbi:MAG: ribose-phosphate pyrophosphokinase [Patescibacteria group bacterium]|nr:ribose-phosphate pyrophosphokinase [Patescibacteria group bacterium]